MDEDGQDNEVIDRVKDAAEIELACLHLGLSDAQKEILRDWVWTSSGLTPLVPREQKWLQV
jgi:hypothetical protein